MDTKTSCEVALTHLKNKQFITAHNLLLDQAETIKKSELLKSALLSTHPKTDHLVNYS